jgi:hypothetical protein
VVTHIENAVEHRETALEAFLDIEGAFESASFEVIIKAPEQHGTGPTICLWLGSMPDSGKITVTLAGETLERSVTKGCPQRAILLPPLWRLVMDKLIKRNQ